MSCCAFLDKTNNKRRQNVAYNEYFKNNIAISISDKLKILSVYMSRGCWKKRIVLNIFFSFSGCTKNSGTKLTLSILTIILSFALMVLTILVYVTCLRHICKEIKYPNIYDVPRRRQRDNARSTRAHQEDRIHVYRTSSSSHVQRPPNSRYSGSYNGIIIEPTAPPEYWGDINVQNNRSDDQISRSNSGLSTEENRFPNHEVGYPRRYEEPPPTYYEVMENDAMETPL